MTEGGQGGESVENRKRRKREGKKGEAAGMTEGDQKATVRRMRVKKEK